MENKGHAWENKMIRDPEDCVKPATFNGVGARRDFRDYRGVVYMKVGLGWVDAAFYSDTREELFCNGVCFVRALGPSYPFDLSKVADQPAVGIWHLYDNGWSRRVTSDPPLRIRHCGYDFLPAG